MSKFYLIKNNPSNNESIPIDDTETSLEKVWSSFKTSEEIKKNKVAKFEELQDVDVTNKKNNQLIAYSVETGKFTTIDGETANEITGTGLKQINKMGIVGTPEKPRKVHIPINTVDFKMPRINVLKYTEGTQDIVTTKNDFTNGESNDFEKNNFIEFDGTAHLKTDYKNEYYNSIDTENGVEQVVDLDLDLFKKIESFEDSEDGVKQVLNVKAIPFDQILIPAGDMNLSNVKHIDFFKITSKGQNIRIIVSADSGKTWKVLKNEKWVNAKLDIKNIKENGMTPEVFNKIKNVFWNELITAHKVRFAYLLSMDNIDDEQNIDKLDLQYDGEGKWLQAKESEFDIIYENNTLLTVLIKFNGDIKINY